MKDPQYLINSAKVGESGACPFDTTKTPPTGTSDPNKSEPKTKKETKIESMFSESMKYNLPWVWKSHLQMVSHEDQISQHSTALYCSLRVHHWHLRGDLLAVFWNLALIVFWLLSTPFSIYFWYQKLHIYFRVCSNLSFCLLQQFCIFYVSIFYGSVTFQILCQVLQYQRNNQIFLEISLMKTTNYKFIYA